MRGRRAALALCGALLLAGSASAAESTGAGPVPRFSAGQQADFDRILARNVPDGRVNQRRQDAIDMIRHVLETLACSPAARGAAPGDLERIKVAGGMINGIPPMALMSQHPKTHCLELTGISGWSMPAPNALMLRAGFRSADTGETGSRQLTIEQGRDGNWRIRQLL